MQDLSAVTLAKPEVMSAPYDTYDLLRREAPVFFDAKLNVYLVTSYELGKAYSTVNASHSGLSNDFNAAVLVQSFIGPVVFGGSVGDRGHHRFYFQLGRFF